MATKTEQANVQTNGAQATMPDFANMTHDEIKETYREALKAARKREREAAKAEAYKAVVADVIRVEEMVRQAMQEFEAAHEGYYVTSVKVGGGVKVNVGKRKPR